MKLPNEVPERNQSDWSGLRPTRPMLLTLPKTNIEVSKILEFCNKRLIPVVPQGGMTGLVSGAHPGEDEVAVSFERMTGVEEIDPVSNTLTALSGTPLEIIQRTAREHNLACGIDLGARGTCTIGGNIATNAGGNHVLRYGMTRENVRSIEVVLANGQIVNSSNKMIKNNAGYDWSQLFIGSEGTLGLITRATIALHPMHNGVESALVQVNTTNQAIKLLRRLEEKLPNGLLTYEAMWKQFYAMAVEVMSIKVPFDSDDKVYILIETPIKNLDSVHLVTVLEEMMELKYIQNAVIAKSETERKSFWALRESVYEHPHFYPSVIGFDISIPLDKMDQAIIELQSKVEVVLPKIPWVVFGHLADSNIHINFMPSVASRTITLRIEQLVYGLVKEFTGSISAEHGIGRMKAPYLSMTRDKAEIELMKTVKNGLDPNGILSPNRIFLNEK